MFHQFIPPSKAGIIEDDEERRRIERGLVEASKDGTALLMGVKYVKEQTGWGLREAKDFVDNFFKRKQNFNE
jgi:ribosomal protein L7/L12